MQQRYYDPGIGRFLSVDPVTADSATGANFNRYWYANNNPYRFTDPDGRESASFYTNSQYRMEVSSYEGVGTVADFTPIVSDIKGIVEAFQNPTFANISAAVVGLAGPAGDTAAKGIKVAGAAAERAKNVAKGIPESRLGPSGKPKVHSVEHSTRKGAKEAAGHQIPPGGKVRNDAHPQDGQKPHFQAENAKGENVKPVVHHCKPDKAC